MKPSLRSRSGAAVGAAAVPDASAAAEHAALEHLLDLVARIAAREERALELLYKETVGRVYGIALRIVRQPEAAEEVAEDVYLQVWKTAQRYDAARGHPLAWLAIMARTRALDYLRGRDAAESHPEPETLAAPALDENDPHALLDSLQSGTAVHAAVAGLPPVQRQLLALAFFQGLSHSEIADHVAMPLGTVKTHLRRALVALRGTLAGGLQ